MGIKLFNQLYDDTKTKLPLNEFKKHIEDKLKARPLYPVNYCFIFRCGTCMDCPNCFNALSVRATSLSRVSEDGAKTPGKVYYLACFICRWTTRDVGIPDQTAGLTDSLIVLVFHLVFSLRSYSTSKDSGQQSGSCFVHAISL